jgi:hypothetical protein
MVIQSNMSPESIVEIWEDTSVIFEKYEVPISHFKLYSLVDDHKLEKLLHDLNEVVGSSSDTCIEGG